MDALFVLVPEIAVFERLADGLRLAAVRAYPRADDERHLLSLVRAGRDPVATRRWRGFVAAVVGGVLLGGVVASVLGAGFGMLGGLELALPFGLLVGAFLGGFTALMTGTEVARDEVRVLARGLRAGDVLVSVLADAAVLKELRARCDAAGVAARRRE